MLCRACSGTLSNKAVNFLSDLELSRTSSAVLG